MNPGHVRLLQWVIFVLVLAHLFACVLYGIVSLEVEYERTWATGVTTVIPGVGPVVLQCPLPLTDPETFEITPDSPTRIGEDHNGVQVLQCMQPDGTWLNEASAFVKYLMSLYVTFTTLTTVGYGDVTMRTSPELFLAIIMMAGGASTFAVVVGNMAGARNPSCMYFLPAVACCSCRTRSPPVCLPFARSPTLCKICHANTQYRRSITQQARRARAHVQGEDGGPR